MTFSQAFWLWVARAAADVAMMIAVVVALFVIMLVAGLVERIRRKKP